MARARLPGEKVLDSVLAGDMRNLAMPTPDEQPISRLSYVLAAVSGAVSGACGGVVLPAGMGLLKPERAGQGGILCFGIVGLLAGFTAAVLFVYWVGDSLKGFGLMLFSLIVGVAAGLFATLPLALLLQQYIRGLNAIGHS
jgi:hypothetical protein